MKKIAFLSILAGLFMVGCTEIPQPADPQTNAQEEILNLPGLVTAQAVSAINLNDVTDSVAVATVSVSGLEAAESLEYILVFNDLNEVDVKADMKVSVEQLQNVVTSIFGVETVERNVPVVVKVFATVNGSALYFESEEISVKVTPLKTIDSYFLVGTLQGQVSTSPDINGWYQDAEYRNCRLYDTDEEGVYTYTSMFSNGGYAGYKIWMQADYGDWDKCYGTVTNNDNSATGTLVNTGAGSICLPDNSTSKVYTITLDFTDNTYSQEEYTGTVTRYSLVGLIGAFNGWVADVEMTEVSQHNWFCNDFVVEEETEFKFRANGGWDISWGANDGRVLSKDNYFGTAEAGGNLKIAAGKYDVYFNSLTYQYCIIPQ